MKELQKGLHPVLIDLSPVEEYRLEKFAEEKALSLPEVLALAGGDTLRKKKMGGDTPKETHIAK